LDTGLFALVSGCLGISQDTLGLMADDIALFIHLSSKNSSFFTFNLLVEVELLKDCQTVNRPLRGTPSRDAVYAPLIEWYYNASTLLLMNPGLYITYWSSCCL
jgi:hypothetical protein